MIDVLDSDGPDYDPEAYAYASDLSRKARWENGERISPPFPVAPDDVRCDTRQASGLWRYRCIRLAGHTGGCHLQLEALMNEIRADHETREVWLDGVLLDPAASLELMSHSPDGFAWGYGGSGPSQLALAILLAVTGDRDVALKHYHDFKFAFVAAWPMDDDVHDEIDVASWIAGQPVEA